MDETVELQTSKFTLFAVGYGRIDKAPEVTGAYPVTAAVLPLNDADTTSVVKVPDADAVVVLQAPEPIAAVFSAVDPLATT